MQTASHSLPRSRTRTLRTDFRCLGCGYGAHARIAPARCPMCGGSTWGHARPTRRAHQP